MVILSSEEFNFQENNRIHMGLKGLTDKINLQTTRGFGHMGNPSPTVETSLNNNEYIGYLMINDRVAASGFGRLDGQEGNKYKTMYLHSISVAEEFRGQGLCKSITDEFIKKFGKNHILYLTVRTESGNENTSGIKCYEKNGFIMLPQVYRDHYDGKNNAMIRLPTNSKNSIRSRRRQRKKTRNKRK
jgi:ribosomal protein S18 acetylase RimI-like enzyme